jgi:hypothetical protein
MSSHAPCWQGLSTARYVALQATTLRSYEMQQQHTCSITTVLKGPRHTPHYSTAFLAVEYCRNSSFCILGDYCNKSEWKLARSVTEENNTNPNINAMSLLLCGCETWTFSKMEEKRLKIFERKI